MVKENTEPALCDLRIDALSGVDINDAAARLQSRGHVSDNQIFEILPRFSIAAGESYQDWDGQYTRRRDDVLTVTGGGEVTGILIGCELVAFERDKDQPSKQLHFGASVDFVVWRRSILLIGLASSEIILVDPNTYGIIFTWKAAGNLDGKKRFFVDAFIHSTPDPTKIDVIVVSRDGLLCVFREIALSCGSLDATHDQNVSLDVDLGSINDISKLSLSITSNVACVGSPSRDHLIVVEELGNVLVVDLTTNIQNYYIMSNLLRCINPVLIKSGVTPKKVTVFEGNIFLLMSNGILEIFTEENAFTSTPLGLPELASSVHDFAICRNDNEMTVKLWVLYSVLSESRKSSYLGIYGGPMFAEEFKFQLPNFNKTGESSHYKFPKNVSPYEEPSTIVEMAPERVLMYHVLETTTDVTLQKLLSRGKYLEAKNLAISYNKDLDIVRKAEARDKLNKMHACNSSECKKLETLWKELLQILNEITDAEFVCSFCVDANLQRVEWVKEILDLGKSRVYKCPPGSKAAKTLLLTIKKFYTFELVYPGGTIIDWRSFISKDNTMFLQSLKFLQNANYKKCERVWMRHWEEFIPEIYLKEFLPFFNVLFDHQLRTLESVSLLKTILPFAVGKVAQSALKSENVSQTDIHLVELEVLFGIIQRQVCTLESKIEWPVNALKFVQILSSVVKDETKRLETSRNEKESVLKKKKGIVYQLNAQLARLEQVLEELAELKRNHSIRILFHDYTNNEIPEVINKLLYKLLSQEEVENFVSNYLRPYAERKNLNVDDLFAEHIKSVLQYIHYYIQAINIPHEERITCLVNLISSTRKQLECALHISQEWPVPWTPGIASMVDRILSIPRMSLNLECSLLYDNIVTMKRQVPYRCVINKYKFNSSKLLSRRVYVTMALLRILKLKKPGYIEDCRELLKHVPSKTLIDGVHLEYIEFILQLYNEGIEEDDVIPTNLQSNTNLKKALLRRAFLELQILETSDHCDIYTEEELQRSVKIYRILANDCKDPRNRMLCRLKQFLPSIKFDVIYHLDFPYTCLTSLIEESDIWSKDPTQLIADCKKLSEITQMYLPDVLLVIGVYFTQTNLTGKPGSVLWNIVEYIVKTPMNFDMSSNPVTREIIKTSAFNIAKFIMLQCPELSLEQMSCLHEFLCRISCSFDSICIETGHLLCYFRIFQSLKEQEIPLESEFSDVYKWLSDGKGTWETVGPKLSYIGETLYKFGEADLCNSVFQSVKRHLQACVAHFERSNEKIADYYRSYIGSIESMKNRVCMQPVDEDEEVDSQMQKLVEDLNQAGIRVNVYALKLRNKMKLLERLLKIKTYDLAAELAITFEFYDNHEIWSRILEGLVTSGNLDDLRRVLERISGVPQLWMLPEFAVGWKKVSDVDSNFLHLCPIPL